MSQLDLAHYHNRHSLGSMIARVGWNIVWALLFQTTPHGNLFRPWRILLLKSFGAKVSWHANVLPSCRIWQPWRLEMGPYACLSQHVDCYNADWIRIGAQATISQDVFLCTASHDMTSPNMELITAPITIGPQSWICARAVIMPGRTVGEGAVVGCAAVVSKDVAPWTVVGGNPAKVIKRRLLNDV